MCCSSSSIKQQAPVDIGNAFLEDKQWDMEAMVISTIAGQLEDKEEEEDVPELLDGVEEGDCDACDEDGSSGGKDAFGGWALGFRGAARCRDSSCEGGCAVAHTSTPSRAVSSDVKSYGSRLPTSRTAQGRRAALQDGQRARARHVRLWL